MHGAKVLSSIAMFCVAKCFDEFWRKPKTYFQRQNFVSKLSLSSEAEAETEAEEAAATKMRNPAANVIKLFTSVIYKCSQ
jgi:hypothetical protein